jgi:tRNA A-37 threonylcarbamoyl transferase component Bud32
MASDIDSILNIRQAGIAEFILTLPDASNFVCHEVVRLIPNRRLVCRGVWNKRAVFMKIFMGKAASAYAQRDKQGVESLLAAHIATPELLYDAAINSDISVLVFAAIIWHQQPSSRLALAKALVHTIAQHHHAGLIQTDLHLKNFLVQSPTSGQLQIYTLDGDGIRQLRYVCSKSQRLTNLATLFSKFDVLDDVWMPELYQLYCSQMGIVSTIDGEADIWYRTQKIRHQVAASYADKKVFRTCTDVKVTQNFSQFVAITSDFNDEILALASLDQHLAEPQRNIKNGNTCTVAKAELAGREVVVKRYNIKNSWHGLSRAVRVSRAAKSWANAHRLIISNIATAKPLALLEQRMGCLRRRAYFLAEYVDAPDALQFFAQCLPLEQKETVARNLASLLYKLYLLKYSHGDCKASNIKIVNSEPVLIDLDAMQVHAGGILSDWCFEKKHIKDLQRLMKNWENDQETTKLLKHALQFAYASDDVNAGDNILIRAGIV